jgi:hypothetical protein
MKTKFIILILFFVIYGCEKSNEPVGIDGKTFFENGVYPSEKLVAKEKLPKWLNVKISEYEDTHPAIFPLIVYQGEWEKRIVYFLNYHIKSCLFCDVYYADGENIVWTNTNSDNFQSTSKNWVTIYVYAFKE